MAVWLWIYDNDFTASNWNIAQPNIVKDLVNNLSVSQDVFFISFLFILGPGSSNYKMEISEINQSYFQRLSSDEHGTGVE